MANTATDVFLVAATEIVACVELVTPVIVAPTGMPWARIPKPTSLALKFPSAAVIEVLPTARTPSAPVTRPPAKSPVAVGVVTVARTWTAVAPAIVSPASSASARRGAVRTRDITMNVWSL